MSDERAKIIAALDAVRKAARDDHGCVFSRGDRRMLMVVRDLVEDQYVKGELERGPAGEVVSCSTRGLTTAGRRLLHELRQEARR